MTGNDKQLHASAVVVGEKGCLIVGESGSGKSTLCIELIALGATLIADDRVDLGVVGDALMLSGPSALRGQIEARGVGIIGVPCAEQPVPCALIVDLAQKAERLPRPRRRDLLGISCPVIFGKDRDGLASIVHVLLHQGRLLDPERGITQ